MGRKELFGCALALQCCSPWTQDWREGRLLGSASSPGSLTSFLLQGLQGFMKLQGSDTLQHFHHIHAGSLLACPWDLPVLLGAEPCTGSDPGLSCEVQLLNEI